MIHIALSTRVFAPHRGQEIRVTSLRRSLIFLCTPVCVVLSSVGCQSPRLRSRGLRPHLSAGRASTEHRQRRPRAEGGATGTEDAVPVGPAAATAAVYMGKGDRGGKGAFKNKRKVASQRGKGKSVTFDEEGAFLPRLLRSSLLVMGLKKSLPGGCSCQRL